ncbi:PTS sugar transporter subunit IIB [Symbiobacterium thermophilum]|uniref:PTS sugar transporter subunit IIB n=1 Tax=Symbiobacterium thermophilum TaxID=2734 RepID=A0A953LLE6_SYMTR|nr:PTS sugar transporter subunit IIB [Symbiobacterium thermophilum]MBY6278077.1 PTS sugar transporter subunit IIB [Symbiobacterium thermophilum]
MKILLICAGGMSTSILMKKLQKYADDNGLGLEKIVARGMNDFEEVYQEFDVILLGPQISYRKEEIQKRVGGKPLAVIAPQDYALGNAEKIFAQINALLGK